MTLLITPPMQKNLLYGLDLPTDILKYIEKFLVVEITKRKIEKTFWQLYNIKNEPDDAQRVLGIFKYIKKYGNNIELIFDKFNSHEPEFSPEYHKTFGNFFITFFYNHLNFPIEVHKAFIDFIKCNIITTKGIDFLGKQKLFLTEIDVRFYCEYTIIDILFGIVFSPEYMINKMKENMEPEEKLEKKIQHNNTKQYIDLLNFLLFDKLYEIVVDDYYGYWTVDVDCDEYVCTWEINNIIDILCFWKDISLCSYISNMMKKIRIDRESKGGTKNLFRQMLNNNGYLLLDALCGKNDIIRYYESPMTKVLVEQDLKVLKKLIKYKNIKTFLISSTFQFRLVINRKVRTVKWFFCKYKSEMKNLRNEKGENLLKVACMSHGLNQNIIKLFLRSGQFDSTGLKFNNRKVRREFNI